MFHLNILSTLKKDIAIKSYDQFTIFHILSAGPKHQFSVKGVGVTNKYLLAKLYQYLGNVD